MRMSESRAGVGTARATGWLGRTHSGAEFFEKQFPHIHVGNLALPGYAAENKETIHVLLELGVILARGPTGEDASWERMADIDVCESC